MLLLMLSIGIVIGLGMPIQTAVNTRLRGAVRSPLIASLIYFTVGDLVLGLLVLVTQPVIRHIQIFQQPWWLWLGGLLGGAFILGNILLLPKLGSFQTALMPIIGQVLMSMVIDNFGLFYSKHLPFSLIRLLGVVILILGAWLIVYVPTSRGNFKIVTPHAGFWRLVGIMVGCSIAAQMAINGHLGRVLHSTAMAAFISFMIGSAVLLIMVLSIDQRTLATLSIKKVQQLPWWAWLGGVIGAIFILGNIVIIPSLGTGPANVIILSGQLLGSLLLQQFGWLQVPRAKITGRAIIGLVLVIIGIILITLL